jgi:hypothetical protein
MPRLITAPRLIVTISAVAAILLLTALALQTNVTSWSFPTASQINLRLFSVEPHLQAKLAHAEKLWSQAVEDRKTMVATSGHNRKFPDGYIHPYCVWDFARPSFFCPHDLERVGSLGDGGKVVCGMSRYERESPGPSSTSNPAQELIVYSFGVNDDSSFEAALLQRTNARIWGYDYTVDSWAKDIPIHQAPRAEFKKVGIGKVTDESHEPPFFTIQDLMKANGHSYVDIVKMDIEGAEFDALSSLISSILDDQADGGNPILPFGQLLVEIHFMDRPGLNIPKDLKTWTEWWSKLELLGLRPVNNEGNWIGDASFGKPRFMEVCLWSINMNRGNLPELTFFSFAVYPDQCSRQREEQAALGIVENPPTLGQ